MPSKSEKQKRFMQAVAHSPEFAKEVGVPQKVGKEFVEADKREAGKHVSTEDQDELIPVVDDAQIPVIDDAEDSSASD